MQIYRILSFLDAQARKRENRERGESVDGGRRREVGGLEEWSGHGRPPKPLSNPTLTPNTKSWYVHHKYVSTKNH